MARQRRTPLVSSRVVSFRLDERERAELVRIATESRRSTSDLLREWIRRATRELDARPEPVDGLLLALAAAD